MKRSEINQVYRDARKCFAQNRWALPPNPKWDITDFGLGNFLRDGLTLINLAIEPEYCEKLMYAKQGQRTPCHVHQRKKEDIICRAGALTVWLWAVKPSNEDALGNDSVTVPINGVRRAIRCGEPYLLEAGHRVTLTPGVWHAFAPASAECIMSEVSTANDDLHDNFFLNPDVGRFPGIEEDEPAEIRIISE